MPTVDTDGATIYYETDGRGEETVVFLGEIGFGAWQWGWQYGAIAGPYRTIVYDTRGCGRSSTPPGPYSMDDLVGDLRQVLIETDTRRAHLVGCGLGGATALAAAERTNRAASLTLVGTAATAEAFDLTPLRADPADRDELWESTEAAVAAGFPADHPDGFDRIVAWRAEEDAAPEAWDAQHAALSGFDAEPLYECTRPALVLHGTDDRLVSVSAGRSLAERLPRGEFVAVDDAGHLAHIERSAAVSDRIIGFLDELVDRDDASW